MLFSKSEAISIELVLVDLGLVSTSFYEQLHSVHVAFLSCIVEHCAAFGITDRYPVVWQAVSVSFFVEVLSEDKEVDTLIIWLHLGSKSIVSILLTFFARFLN